MNSQAPIDEEDKPLDPAMERVRRKMVRLLVISIGIMMAGLMAVLYAIVYKVSNSSNEGDTVAEPREIENSADSGFNANLNLPAGSRVISQSVDGRRMSVLTETPQGAQSIHVFDLADGVLIGRIELSRP